LDLETFVEHARRFASLERHVGRRQLQHALGGQNVLDYEAADHVADFLEELSEDLDDEIETVERSEQVRRAPRGGATNDEGGF